MFETLRITHRRDYIIISFTTIVILTDLYLKTQIQSIWKFLFKSYLLTSLESTISRYVLAFVFLGLALSKYLVNVSHFLREIIFQIFNLTQTHLFDFIQELLFKRTQFVFCDIFTDIIVCLIFTILIDLLTNFYFLLLQFHINSSRD